MPEYNSRTVDVGGFSTHYLEAGSSGQPLVLLHSGEYGACTESSWNSVVPLLVEAGFHVFAPDWLGFGRSDKVVDFANPKKRRIAHMGQFIESLQLPELPVLIGNSMGGTYLAQELAQRNTNFNARGAVLVSGGGFVPNNEARRLIQDYDLTIEGMRSILGTLLFDSKWTNDEAYVRWRHELSLVPGAWQCAASARLHPPTASGAGSEDFGKPDATLYENIECPTLVIAGADDPLREPGYADDIAARIPRSQLKVYENCGHMPNIEHPQRFASDVTTFCRSLTNGHKKLPNLLSGAAVKSGRDVT